MNREEVIEALEDYLEHIHRKKTQTAITELRQAIEQAEKQEPVAYVDENEEGMYAEILPDSDVKVNQLLYTHPPAQRQVACKPLCELCIKRGYDFCANTAKTTVITAAPTAPAQPTIRDSRIVQVGRTDGIVGWRWIATCGSGAYQLRSDEPMRGYSYKAPVYELLPTAPAQQPLTEDQIDAARYRWLFNDISLTALKQSFDNNTPLSPDSLHSAVIEQIVGFYTVKEDADAIIDAAMKGEKT